MTSFPFSFTRMSEDEKAARRKLWTGPTSVVADMIRYDNGVLLPPKFEAMADQVYNFKLRPDDIIITTSPKAGTTWTQEMVWQIVNNVDLEEGKKQIFLRTPFLEFTALGGDAPPVPAVGVDPNSPEQIMGRMMADSVSYCDNLASPRVIKSHLPIEMLPPQILETCKVIYVARNPKDSCVSFYHHEMLLPNQAWSGPFDVYQEYYKKGEVLYGKYFNHLLDAWKRRDNKNLKFLWYEDMKADLPAVIDDICGFLGYSLTPEKKAVLVDHLAFENFKKNSAVNMEPPKGSVPEEARKDFSFIRKGQVGDYKNFFTPEKVEEWNNWIKENVSDPELLKKVLI